jgi:hypothetical protein
MFSTIEAESDCKDSETLAGKYEQTTTEAKIYISVKAESVRRSSEIFDHTS